MSKTLEQLAALPRSERAKYVLTVKPVDNVDFFAPFQAQITGAELKRDVHTVATPMHLAFSCFIFDGQGNVLLQQRAQQKPTWGGVWSNSCCGHLVLEEDIHETVRQRVAFELGITDLTDVTCVVPSYYYRAVHPQSGIVEHEYCPIFIAHTRRQPRPNPEEVMATEWVAWEELQRWVLLRPDSLSPWCVEEVALLDLPQVSCFSKEQHETSPEHRSVPHFSGPTL